MSGQIYGQENGTGRRAERRNCSRLLTHWNRSRRGADIPALGELELGRRTELSDSILLLREDQVSSFSVVVLCGDAQRQAFLEDPVGQTLLKCLPDPISEIFCNAVAKSSKSQSAIEEEGKFLDADGTEVLYRAIFLPVRSGGGPNDTGKSSYVLTSLGRKPNPSANRRR